MTGSREDSTSAGPDRRTFLRASGAAAGGAVVLAAGEIAPAEAKPSARSWIAEGDSAPDLDDHSVIVHVLDAKKGRVSVLTGETEIRSTDPELVRHLSRAVRSAKK